ncbi:hypothetical protein [Haladaptatus sp. NG-WS-4]
MKRLLVRLTVWFVALVVGVTPAHAHGTAGHGGAPVTFAVVLGLPIVAGLVGGVVIVRGRNETHRTEGTHPSGVSLGLLLVILGITFSGTAISRSLSLGIGSGIVGLLSVRLAVNSRTSDRRDHRSHANLSLGAVSTHRLLEGIVLGGLYSSGAAVGLLGAVVIAGHTAFETIAVGGLYAPHRLRIAGAVVLVQAGFTVGAIVGVAVSGTVPPSVHTIALALVGGILLGIGLNEARHITRTYSSSSLGGARITEQRKIE